MKSETTIDTLHLFPILDQHLHELLVSLSDEDWKKQTLAPKWKVKDVAAHLLDGSIRGISVMRDHYFGGKATTDTSYKGVVNFLDGLNADWVDAMKRVSPAVLIELLQITGQSYNSMLKELDPFGEAIFSVGWAGEEKSLNWFHIAREYTEKWHHQQQIGLAVGKEDILYSRELYYPYLETSMRALPYHYRSINAKEGEKISFTITGEGGGRWILLKSNGSWILTSELLTDEVSANVVIDGKIVWRIFTRGISTTEAESALIINGDHSLANHFARLVAVMA